MKVAVIALILSIAALGLGSFATFTSLNSDEATSVAAQPGWSTAECQTADASLDELEFGCVRGNCDAYSDMIRAINDNCP